MKLSDFELERYFARHEFSAPYLLCCSDCETLTVQDLLELEPEAKDSFMNLGLGYTESSGHPDLRVEIAGLYEKVTESGILVFSGAEEAIFIFLNVVLGPGDHAVVQWPCYQSLFEVGRAAGAEISLWEMTPRDWSLDLDRLQGLLRPNTRAIVVNSPHNPTGAVFPARDWTELAHMAEDRGITIFSDEVYRFLEFSPQAVRPPLADLSPGSVSLGVMSKSLGLPGLRIGWIATQNQNLFQKFAAFKDYTTICNSSPSEYLARLALRHKKSLLDRNLSITRKNLEILDPFFRTHEAFFHWVRPQAGPIAFPELKKEASARQFCDRLRQTTGVLLLPGDVYGACFSKNFRIGFGRTSMKDGLERLDDFLTSDRPHQL